MDLKLKVSTFEYLCCRVILAGASTVVVSIYSVAMTITGDINIHFERAADVNTCKVMETLESFVFHQFVGTPTHELGGVLDVIVAPSVHPPEDVVVDDVGLSDHMLVSWSVNLAPPLQFMLELPVVLGEHSRRRTSSAD